MVTGILTQAILRIGDASYGSKKSPESIFDSVRPPQYKIALRQQAVDVLSIQQQVHK